MDVKTAIKNRRAFRSLEKFEITDQLIDELGGAAQLAPSCFNNQPWRYVFVFEQSMLEEIKDTLTPGNAWAKQASMIIAVCSKKDDDCVIRDREYYLFDSGLATSQMILRATELGLIMHPIAGFSPKGVRAVLGVPEAYQVIALLIVGKHSSAVNSLLSEKQQKNEKQRPERLSLDQIIFRNKFVQ